MGSINNNCQKLPHHAAPDPVRFFSRPIFSIYYVYQRRKMPHSKRKNKSIERRMRSIDIQLKKVTKLHHKQSENDRVIYHPSVTLGELRSRFSPQHKELPEKLLREVDTFERIECDSIRRL